MEQPGRRTCSTDIIMNDCARGREGRPSAPRVEHRYKAGERINDCAHLTRLKPSF